MKAVSVLLMLALAGSAFGAVTLTAPAEVKLNADSGNMIPAGTTFSFALTLTTQGEPMNGISTFPTATAPGINLTGRTIGAPTITDPTKTDAALGIPFALPLAIDWSKDLGTTSAADPIAAWTGTYETLTFATTAPVAVGTQIRFVETGWGDTDFGFNPLPNIVVTLTPEPASMLLLAVGAAFFARRRRA